MRTKEVHTAWTAASLAMLASLVGACGDTGGDARVQLPETRRATFPPVSAYLDHRCGSLDCHGSSARNFIVYGCEGLRLSKSAVPGCRSSGGTDTTDAEIDATFRSLVGLEPVVFADVAASGGARAGELTVVRKPRGDESHKGGTLVKAGDPSDRCLTSWIGGATDAAACQAAAMTTP